MKAKTCNWCGERIGPDDIRVKLPIKNTDSAFTYHADCYVRVYDRRCLRALLSDDYPHGIMAWARRSAILDALDPEKDEGSPLDVADYQYEAERWEWVARLFNRMLTNSTGYDQLPAALDRFETQERWDHAADHWTETQP